MRITLLWQELLQKRAIILSLILQLFFDPLFIFLDITACEILLLYLLVQFNLLDDNNWQETCGQFVVENIDYAKIEFDFLVGGGPHGQCGMSPYLSNVSTSDWPGAFWVSGGPYRQQGKVSASRPQYECASIPL